MVEAIRALGIVADHEGLAVDKLIERAYFTHRELGLVFFAARVKPGDQVAGIVILDNGLAVLILDVSFMDLRRFDLGLGADPFVVSAPAFPHLDQHDTFHSGTGFDRAADVFVYLAQDAWALVKPTIADVKTASMKKKMKDKAFARSVRREDIVQGAAELGVDLDAHISFCIEAMQRRAGDLGLELRSGDG
jgi:hypothetical protein